MFKTQLIYQSLKKGIALSFILSSLMISAIAEARQQTAILDANGNPIPNDVLLMLGGVKKAAPARSRAPRVNTQRNNRRPLRVNNNAYANNNARRNILNNMPKKRKGPVSTPERERELLEALLIGQTAKATHLIRAGVRVNHENYKGETPLSVAVDRGWASMVVDLIEHGGKLRQKNSRGLSLLHRATAKGYTDLAKALIKHGLNPASTTTKDWNSLHIAARYGRWQLVQLYLNMGVNPNERTSDGKTALEIAQIVRHPGMIKVLAQVTSARPQGRAANYDRRHNRKKYDELESFKQSKIARKRKALLAVESIRQAKIAHKRAILKELGAIRWRRKNGKCGPNNIYCIPKLTEE